MASAAARTLLRSQLVLLFLLSGLRPFAQPGAIDATFNPTDQGFDLGAGPTGSILDMAIQSDGKILIGGDFQTYNGTTVNRIARLNADGTLDGTFNASGTGANSILYSVAIQSDGKILIGGNFTTYNGTSINRIARLNADGTLDGTFNATGTGSGGSVNSITVLSDGKILIAGDFTTYNGTSINRIARLNADGTLDGTFTPGTGANGVVYSVAVQSDGKILIGGFFTQYNGAFIGRIVRLNANGTLDVGYNQLNAIAADDEVYSIAIQSDGKILVCGRFTRFYGISINGIARLNADGTLDGTFNATGTGANSFVYSLAIQSDGKILISGFFSSYNGTEINKIARLNSDGTLDGTFTPGTGLDGLIYSIEIQSDGKMLIGGGFSNYNGTNINSIGRLNANAVLDASFNPGTGANGTVSSIAVQPDGKFLIGGSFTRFNGTLINRIARLNSDGTLDGTFNPGTGASGTVNSIAVQSDGKILIGGAFTTYNGTTINRIARLNSDGTLDGTFNATGTGANSDVNSIAIQSDGKILIGGVFSRFNSTTNNRSRIARLNSDGTLDGTFDPGTGANNDVFSIVVQSDGRILVGGRFTTYDGTTVNRIVRLNAGGTRDATFAPVPSERIRAIAVQSDGKILIVGQFVDYDGTTFDRIARLNADGTRDVTFTPVSGADATVFSIVVQSDGRILIGGNFTTYDGTTVNRIARLNANGTLDATFTQGTGLASVVNSMALQSDGRILIGGQFTSYNGTGRNRLARLLNPCTNPTSGGTIDGVQSGAGGFDPAPFTSAAASGHSGILEYKWQSSTTSSSSGFSDIASSNSATYDPGPLTQTTWYKRLARVSCRTDWTGAAESNVLEVTVSSLAAQPTAQPTALYFTTTGTNPYNLVGRFTASASATGYLVVRNTGSAPTFTPADGTAYAAGSQTGGTVVYSGTATEFTESSVTNNTAYHYAVYAYNGSGATINYLTTAPLTGQAQALTSGSGTLASGSTATSLGFPAAGATVNFPAGTSGTTLNVTKNNSAPSSNIQVSSSIRGMKPIYFSITSSTASPGGYTLILDFSGLGNLSPTQWNSYKVTKRANASSPWVDVTTLGATIVNRQTDGTWGKFTITGLSSFSEFGLAEVYDGVLVSNLDQPTASFPVTVNDRDLAGQAFVTDGIRYQLTKVKVAVNDGDATKLIAKLYGADPSDGSVNTTSPWPIAFGLPAQVGSTNVYEFTPSSPTVKLEPNTQYWVMFYTSDGSTVALEVSINKTETGPADYPTNLSGSSNDGGTTFNDPDALDPILFSVEATEVSRTWTGTDGTSWTTAGNWTPAETPGSGEILTIPNVANDPVLPANTSVSYLTIGSGAVLTLADKNLTVTHGLSHDGTMTGTTGKLIMAGTATQGIEGTGTLSNLEINNAAGVAVFAGSHRQSITGAIIPTAGTLTTNGNLTLKSSSSGTARVATLGATASISGEVVAERFIKQNTNTGGTGRAWRLVSIPVTGSGTLRDFFMNGRNGQDLTVSTNRDAETANSGTPIVGHNHATASAANTAGFDWIGVANQVSSLRRYVGNATGGTFLSENVPVMTTDYSNADQGYMVFTRGDRKVEFPSPSNASATTFRSTGALKTGDQTVSVVPSGTSQYTLVGNPYMSVLDLSLLHAQNSAVIKPSFWIWDANIAGTHKQGGYVRVSFNGTSWVTNTGAYTNPERIESGMAFFVEPIDGLSGATNITIKEAHKSAATSAGIVPYGSESSDGHGLFYARLETPASGGVREVVDGVLIDFHKDFKESLGDLGDGEKLRNTISQGALWLSREGRNLVAEGLPWPGADKRSIPLYMGSVGVQQRVLRLDPRGMADRYVKAWLKDRHLNTETEVDMSKGLDYAFTGTGSAATDLERFELVFVEAGRPTTGGVAIEPGGGSPSVRLYPNPSRSTEVRLSLRSMPAGEYRVEVLDMSGRMVARTRFTHRGDSGEYSVLEGRRLSPGRYVVRLIDCNGVVQVLQLVGR